MWVRMFFKSTGSLILDCSYSHSDTVCRKSVKQGNLESQHNFASIQNNTIQYNTVQHHSFFSFTPSERVWASLHSAAVGEGETLVLLYLPTLSSMHGTELQYNRFKCMSHLFPDAHYQLPVVKVAKTAWKVSKCSHKDVTAFYFELSVIVLAWRRAFDRRSKERFTYDLPLILYACICKSSDCPYCATVCITACASLLWDLGKKLT